MSNAYIIEVNDHTVGIVARNGRGFCFFSSERLFAGLEGRIFFTVREAERAAQALLTKTTDRARRL